MSLENSPIFLLNLSDMDLKVEEKHFYQFKNFRLHVEERQLFNDENAVPINFNEILSGSAPPFATHAIRSTETEL